MPCTIFWLTSQMSYNMTHVQNYVSHVKWLNSYGKSRDKGPLIVWACGKQGIQAQQIYPSMNIATCITYSSISFCPKSHCSCMSSLSGKWKFCKTFSLVYWSDVFLWVRYGKVVVTQTQKFCECTLCLEYCMLSSDDLALFKIVTCLFIWLVYLKETRRVAF